LGIDNAYTLWCCTVGGIEYTKLAPKNKLEPKLFWQDMFLSLLKLKIANQSSLKCLIFVNLIIQKVNFSIICKHALGKINVEVDR
jgi:hypothetical protein